MLGLRSVGFASLQGNRVWEITGSPLNAPGRRASNPSTMLDVWQILTPMNRLAFAVPLVLFAACADVPLYSTCDSKDECVPEADACFVIDWIQGRGQMCSLYCDDDSDCFGDARCFELVGDPLPNRVCYARCDTNLDCEPGFVCADTQSGSVDRDDVCLPQ